MRIVIIGSGQAGANVAVGLREEGFDGEIILVGDEPGVPFGRPPLSKTYLRDEEGLDGWLVKPEEWYDAHDVDLRNGRVERIVPAGRRVVLSSGDEITCDRLCIATGCRPRMPDLPGIELDGVFALRTRDDADRIKAAATTGAKAVIAGMGFIGSEVAASLCQIGVEVAAVSSGIGPFASVLGDEVSRRMTDVHREHGVQVIANAKVTGFRGAARVEQVTTDAGDAIDCSFVVAGFGVDPNVGFTLGSGIDVDDGIVVDRTCETSVPGVYAVGDVASHDHPLFGRVRVEHYNNAEKQGRHVAKALLGGTDPYDYVHTFWSDNYDHKIEYVGHAKRWDEFVVRGDVDDAFLGFYVADGVLRAAVGFDRGGDPELEPESELATVAELIRRRTRVDARSLADETVALTSVASP
jgi:3-phenylpropionate/trans-cinnamate dioxygenase ferredoxin reductase component